MRKLSIKDLVDFRRKSDRSKKTFAAALGKDEPSDNSDGGGDYWVTSLSAISNAFRENDLEFISAKRRELEKKYKEVKEKRTKVMHGRNIDILKTYEDHDFNKSRPSKNLTFLKKNKSDSILSVKSFDLIVRPHHVFTFGKEDALEVGAIWFIAKLEGLNKNELSLFADVLNKYLKASFSKVGVINQKYCLAVDVYNNIEVTYAQVEKGEIPSQLNPTLDEIKKLM